MHASIWKFAGEPEALLRGYDGLVTEIPSANMRLHLCLRAPDGILLVDTCPTREAFESFAASDAFRSACARHGLPEPVQLEDFPVHRAFVDGLER